MVKTHILGFPRIGSHRELKKNIEAYWNKKISEAELHKEALRLKQENWQRQADKSLDYITMGDFAYYDQILDFSIALGVIDERFQTDGVSLTDLMSQMGRGRDTKGHETPACEMTKWFDTNYHYIVPEFSKSTKFRLNAEYLTGQIAEAKKYGKVKFVIPGAITFLHMGKERNEAIQKVDFLPALKKVYAELFVKLKEAGVSMIQIDEPALVTDLPDDLLQGFYEFYADQNFAGLPAMLSLYFGKANADLKKLLNLPFSLFHFDCIRGHQQLDEILKNLPAEKSLSLGVIDGRNIWKSNLSKIIADYSEIQKQLGERFWLAPSCSLLHSPVDLVNETKLNPEILNWLSFAVQKLEELECLKNHFNSPSAETEKILKANAEAVNSRETSTLIHRPEVKKALKNINESLLHRKNIFAERKKIQQKKFNLPLFPGTSIGSFPQTSEIRKVRSGFKKGTISSSEYEQKMKTEIQENVKIQEELGLDVLVHGEPERNDMVEYFGEQLDGFIFTENAWVQSYGSRCVKPPIIYGDVNRNQPMTIEWSRYAQSLTGKKMKGMLTGPVTILQWSFVRDDQSREKTCKQIALALLEEVKDLEKAGIDMIQVDEPALREGLPLAKKDWDEYLKWACESFRLATSDVADSTQIHTHMCYCEFNEIMGAISSLDADVISIETSRSQMDLLDSFQKFKYPNDIGPGVYDIHSPRIPTKEEMVSLLKKSCRLIPAEQIWVNPDCGLKTRSWEETKPALANMMEAAREMRQSV